MKYTGYAVPVTLGTRLAVSVDPQDQPRFQEVLRKAKGRIKWSIETETKARSGGQLRLYWKVVTIICQAVNGKRPTDEEKEAMNEEIKALKANRRRAALRPEILVPVGMSSADTDDATALIEGAFEILYDLDLNPSLQMEARGFFQEYWALGGQKYTSEADFRERAHYCAACSRGGQIQLAHIQSRGANHARINDPENWIPLCPECHGYQHQHGVEKFLQRFPHLVTRWKGAA